ncbi:hypothetical protein G4B88_027309 [Cannabis sativa]|uniref:eRF1/Pelota-like N-terminal domain-containing protein n=1 Tax=Cannabis sativa TaxID=3483 RepID=A0A7J6HS42_CANSA|nr:hypothetical protein G4B88_027309 [Cannabis sativa]
MADGQESDKNIEIWKIKKLIKALESARGNGTSMISLIMPPRDQISRVTKMLGDEFGTASNIKSRVNRQSVLGAITSAQQRLKLYNKVPPNGLVLYTGTIVTDDGKEKKVTIDFEPFKPINASLYLCDNKFHTEALNELLESDDKFGFIVMDGNGTLFGTLSGNTREVLHKFTVDLPKKHGRGGQSALRFARLRMEKRHNYVRKTAELATQFYINPATSQPNVSGLILAGSADFKTELSQSDMFDPRLQAKILNVVDVSYGGENGFNQAIELSAEILSNVKFIQEKRLIGKYFEEISQDTGKYVFGVDDTLKALEMGAVETLIVWENLDINRYVLKHGTTGEIIVKHLNKDQDNVQSHFRDPATAAELEVQEKMPLLEWFANEYKRFGCTLEFVTNKSQEGSQFCRGFGGIGGILRYQLDMRSFDELSDDGETKQQQHSFLLPFRQQVTMADGQESDKNIEIWKIKKLIKALESARGNGTSMISLIMPPRDQISRVTKMLGDEFGTASNIKSRVNRQSVLGAITSAQQRLKLYNKVPPNGLVLYTGTIVTDDGKEKKVTIDFEPFKPINASLYLCDNKFHTEALNELLESDDKFGFIVMDGNGTLFGTLSGNTREVLHKFTVDLPKKHGRGGQSALRFARLRMEKRHNYVRKTAELATQFYINPATSQPNVSGLILAGSADFKTELSQSDMFDPRLQAKILNVVDVSYGGENGFNQAIELSAEILSNVKFIQEKRLIGKYFEEISQDTGKYVFGVDDTLKALEMGAVETLIVYVLKHSTTGEIIVKHLNKDQDTVQSHFRDADTSAELEVQEKMPLLEWFANEYKRFGCTLEFVTNKSQEGSQFCRGFGGIGGILRYQLDMRSFDELSDDGEVHDMSMNVTNGVRIGYLPGQKSLQQLESEMSCSTTFGSIPAFLRQDMKIADAVGIGDPGKVRNAPGQEPFTHRYPLHSPSISTPFSSTITGYSHTQKTMKRQK